MLHFHNKSLCYVQSLPKIRVGLEELFSVFFKPLDYLLFTREGRSEREREEWMEGSGRDRGREGEMEEGEG